MTSTTFSDAYADLPMVGTAKGGVLTTEIAAYLAGRAPIAEKAAVINALGWSVDGQHNAVLYAKIVLHRAARDVRPRDLLGDDAFVFGYLVLLDDYLTPARALPFLAEARTRKPRSLAVAAVEAVARAQLAGEKDFCLVWPIAEKLQDPALERDLRPEALQIILDYLGEYRRECRDDLPPPATDY